MKFVFLSITIAAVSADSIILRNDCVGDSEECDIILETLTGSPERDCNIFSSEDRLCSQNDTILERKEMIPPAITIYDSKGAIVLQWNKNATEEPNARPTYASHIVPKSEWNRPPIFWKRRRRGAPPRGPESAKIAFKTERRGFLSQG
ncbi:hypothetical protein OESDEN_08061 [Oesophagostomum dentatum]|uniref:Uncharacterized protein n=1 Tax=Oesophagostomum dentatum TaxID=61180 RepID=A0A0B1T4A5_OESDE|nr:hypothetical protein OESDEN_08061 [Oesophagostomum dentatum]